jgi:hypothetical protein
MTATGSAPGRVDNPKQELRNETRRRRFLKKARITFKDRWATIDCTVRNLSERGACLRVCPKSSSSQTKLSEHEANRGETEKSECVSGEIFKILGQAATAIEPCEGAFDDPPPW